ncbi:MAG: hypothetical protein ACD_12C00133G0004 [uncultured bacterium]|nr:MAG: hypothetical protein ACD_12C00133G0004 [uncultured bacterium]
MKIFLPKKISWLILTFFFTFDAVVSYIAVTRMNGKEANLGIAFAVEKHPLLYFLTIPGLIIIISLIIKGLTNLSMKLLNKNKLNKEIVEQIILTAVVIHWVIANSFMNLIFIIGHRLSIIDWYKLSALGLISAIIYFAYTLSRFKIKSI